MLLQYNLQEMKIIDLIAWINFSNIRKYDSICVKLKFGNKNLLCYKSG